MTTHHTDEKKPAEAGSGMASCTLAMDHNRRFYIEAATSSGEEALLAMLAGGGNVSVLTDSMLGDFPPAMSHSCGAPFNKSIIDVSPLQSSKSLRELKNCLLQPMEDSLFCFAQYKLLIQKIDALLLSRGQKHLKSIDK
ncbi:hypothetical protein N5D37_12960 [Comamonas aquatica]|uniref:hypothetical protein n=1 Tax=Comamonas aquatica TaxID=225991 RepID=UPI002446F8DF|nr:hypothetical protein [Comamonas aquatica]MDH1766537.1 hypothetical protein [Comamonas aquatica]